MNEQEDIETWINSCSLHSNKVSELLAEKSKKVEQTLQEFQDNIDSLRNRVNLYRGSNKRKYRAELNAFKKQYDDFNATYEFRKGDSNRNELLGDIKLDEIKDPIGRGKQVLADSKDSLVNTRNKVIEIKQIAIDTAIELDKQTDQIHKITNDLDKMDNQMNRTMPVIRSMARRVVTDKYACALVMLLAIGLAIYFYLHYK
jgi:hypothetical protein